MKHLRRKIVWYFILFAFLLQVAVSALDSTFEFFTNSYLGQKDTGGWAFAFGIFFTLNILFFVLAAFCFYRFVKKAVAKEAKQQAEEQRIMYASLAHDLKTPLTSVVGFASSLIDRKIPLEKQDDVLGTIHDKAVQMNVLLESMLSYSKLGAANYSLHMEKTDFCKFIRNISAGFYTDFESHGMNLSVEIPEKNLFVMADKTELSRAVGNLISNAISHNPAGTEVLVKIIEDKKSLRLIIADTGNEIAEADAEKIFTPFVSGNEARTAGKNSGLGLAISRKEVQLHGGKLYLDLGVPRFTKAFVMEVPKCKE